MTESASGVAEGNDGAPVSATQPRGRRVLVVDDNADSAEMLVALFSMWGHDVRTAYDGAAALEVVAEFSPDAIFLDIGLPGLDGYEVARRIRATEAGKGARIIALSGYAADEDRRKSREAGFDLHLAKPADFNALEQALA